jgi:hypothetical protein
MSVGDERTGIDIPLSLVPLATIEGTVVSPDGAVPRVQFIVNSDAAETQSMSAFYHRPAITAPGADGRFRVTNVAPANYSIVVRTVSSKPASGVAEEPVLFAAADVAVNGDDVMGLVPASYRVTATWPGRGSGLWLRSLIAGGKDVLDVGLDVRAGADLTGAVLTLSDRDSSLSGTLQVPADQTPSAYFIVVYPADRTMWRPRMRRIQMVRPGTDGRFMTTGLPAGEYYLAVLTDVESEDLADPPFFESLITSSVKVTIAEGEQKTQDLTSALCLLPSAFFGRRDCQPPEARRKPDSRQS